MGRKGKRRGREQRSGSKERRGGRRSWFRSYDILLAALVALVVARTLVPEDPGGQHGYGAPIDMLWLVLAGAWMLVRWRGESQPLRFGWPDVLVIALVAWHTISALVASAVASPRPAMNLLWDWVSMGVLFLLARQLIATSAAARGVVVAMIGLACGHSAIAVHQSLVTIPTDTRAFEAVADRPAALYELTGQWLPPGTSARQQFEARLASALPTATFALSNSLAGFLVPWFVMLVAVVLSRPGRAVTTICAAIAILLAACIWLTGSRSAGVSIVVGVVALAIFRAATANLSRRLLWVATGGAAIVAVVGVGALFATTAGRTALDAAWRSVAYRVEYWQATVPMIADYPLFGCGPGQFQDTYTAYKLPAAAEEVQDPHNWLLEVWATAGTPAAVVLVAFLVVVVLRVTQFDGEVLDAGNPMPDAEEKTAAESGASVVGGLVGVALGLAIGWLSGFMLLWIQIGLLVTAMVGVWWLLRNWVRRGTMPPGIPLIAAGTLLVNLLVAGGIGYPSVADSLWLLLAMAVNVSERAKPQAVAPRQHLRFGFDTPVTRWIAGLTLAAILAVAIRYEYIPVLTARLQWALADGAIAAGEPALYRDAVEAAVAADPWSVPAAARLAALRFSDYEVLSTDTQLDRYLVADERVRELAPRRSEVWAESARRVAAIFRTTENVEYRGAAARYFERAIALYPTDTELLAEAAKFWHENGQTERAATAASDALACDDAQRAAGHRDRQLSDALRAEMETIADRPML